MITYPKGAERPAAGLRLLDNGTPVDLSSGYTFNVTINFATPLVKTTGITGSAGTSNTPNLSITWAANDLNVTPGRYRMTVTATSGGLDYKWTLPIQITDAD